MQHLRIVALAAAMGLCASAAMAQTACPTTGAGDCGFSFSGAGASPQQLLSSTGGKRGYYRGVNNGPGNLWCTSVSGGTPAVMGAGSYQIVAGQSEEYPIPGSTFVPQGALSCVADGATTGSVRTN